MPLTDYTKGQLVKYLLAEGKKSYRSGPNLVKLFNKFGIRDEYRDGLPENPRNGLRYSRTQYVEDRIRKLEEHTLIDLITYVIKEDEVKDEVAIQINNEIHEDGYSVELVNGEYQVLGGVIDRRAPVVNQAKFQGIQNQILHALDEAQVFIWVYIAWFTNDVLRDKLLERQAAGVEIRIAIYDDGINRRHGVDLTGLTPIMTRRAVRGGIPHNKFCIIDNQVVITGSYNWSENAEYRNDENIVTLQDPKLATEYSVEFKRLIAP